MKSVLLGIAFLGSMAMLASLQPVLGREHMSASPISLDTLPVTDPQLYRPENVRRFMLHDTEWCAPRVVSLVVFIPSTTGIPLGAKVMLNPDTLTNFNQRPYHDGKPNPDWRNGMSIGISPAKEGWGFPRIVKTDIGKTLEEITDNDFSNIDDIAKEMARSHSNFRTDLRSRFALVKLDGVVVRLRWSPAGDIHLVYPVGEGAVGSLDVTSPYIERLESLFKIARHFFRPCASIRLDRN